jgi:hypothetical protein
MLLGHEGSDRRGLMVKGSNNQHVVGGCMWQGAGVRGAWCPSLPLLETTSLAPAEALWVHSLQRWRLSFGDKEEVAATKAMAMAVTMVAGMLSSWRLQEQVLDGAIRASRGRHGRC